MFWGTLGFSDDIKNKKTEETKSRHFSTQLKRTGVHSWQELPGRGCQQQIFNLFLNWEIQCKNFSAHIKSFMSSPVCPLFPGVAFPQVRNRAEQSGFAIFCRLGLKSLFCWHWKSKNLLSAEKPDEGPTSTTLYSVPSRSCDPALKEAGRR